MIRQIFLMPLVLIVLLLAAAAPASAKADQVNRMSKETLFKNLEQANLVILDVRIKQHWNESDLMIKGAIRRPPESFNTWSSDLPRDKMLVLYCA